MGVTCRRQGKIFNRKSKEAEPQRGVPCLRQGTRGTRGFESGRQSLPMAYYERSPEARFDVSGVVLLAISGDIEVLTTNGADRNRD
ncbi:MAG: hypothetical protein GDA48_07935 [Hormoscilla sp. GM102CHS1]|nr:hypothetical protein [Hormoscilla sp. GM102CHS1]